MTSKRSLLLVALLVVLASSVVAWAQSVRSVDLGITAGGAQGKIATITRIGETFSVSRGAAQVINGVELYRIGLGNAQFSNQVRIEIVFINPHEIGQVLQNPNSFIQVGVYYEGTGAGQVTLDYDGKTVIPDGGSRASAILSRVTGDVFLYPTVANRGTLYVLSSITVPANAPPGQQAQLTELRFWSQIEK